MFLFVLCIHLVPSCNSLLMFVSNFSVFLIIILMCLFTFLFIYLLILSIKTWISLLICLFIICEFTQSVKTRISLSIYLHIYLFLYSFTWIVLYLFTHNLYIVLLVSSIFSCFHWMKCRFVQTHPLGGQRWIKICLSVSESSGIRSKEKGSISREVNLVLHNHIFFICEFYKRWKWKGHLYIISNGGTHLICSILLWSIQYTCNDACSIGSI